MTDTITLTHEEAEMVLSALELTKHDVERGRDFRYGSQSCCVKAIKILNKRLGE